MVIRAPRTVVGMCALCRSDAELQNSHFVPAALFKSVIQACSPYAEAPVMVDVIENSAVQINAQFSKHLLCSSCEGRFSQNGEDHVISNTVRNNGEFRLRDALKSTERSLSNNGRSIFLGGELPPELRATAYYYFFVSILWRASVTDWPGATGVKKGCLGAKYQEMFRRYLLGEFNRLPKVSVRVHVNFDTDPDIFLTVPTHAKVIFENFKVNRYSFYMPGIWFVAHVGGNLPTHKLDGISAQTSCPIFIESHLKGTELRRRLAEDVARAIPKGKLARAD